MKRQRQILLVVTMFFACDVLGQANKIGFYDTLKSSSWRNTNQRDAEIENAFKREFKNSIRLENLDRLDATELHRLFDSTFLAAVFSRVPENYALLSAVFKELDKRSIALPSEAKDFQSAAVTFRTFLPTIELRQDCLQRNNSC